MAGRQSLDIGSGTDCSGGAVSEGIQRPTAPGTGHSWLITERICRPNLADVDASTSGSIQNVVDQYSFCKSSYATPAPPSKGIRPLEPQIDVVVCRKVRRGWL